MAGTSPAMTTVDSAQVGTALVLSRVDQIAEDTGLAELLAGFEPLQALHQDETIAVTPHQDRSLLAKLHDALGEFIDRVGLELGAAFDRDIDVGDRNRLALHHGWVSAAHEGAWLERRPPRSATITGAAIARSRAAAITAHSRPL